MANQDLRALFDSFDLNKNGVLTRGELITAIRVKAKKEGASDDLSPWGFQDLDDVAAFFDQADTDHTKEVTFDEFATALTERQAG